MAVAGFGEDEIGIEVHRNVLTIKGEKVEQSEQGEAELLYRGIAGRAFERRFQLADHVEVTGAELKNGLLHIDLKREVPEELRPRRIEVTAATAKKGKQIEAKAA
jgi:molecular chaperone IbpA